MKFEDEVRFLEILRGSMDSYLRQYPGEYERILFNSLYYRVMSRLGEENDDKRID